MDPGTTAPGTTVSGTTSTGNRPGTNFTESSTQPISVA